MKIQSNLSTMSSKMPRGESASPHPIQAKSFSDMMRQQEERASREQLQQMLSDIQRQAERLARSMSVKELHGYKLLIRRFLEETIRRGVVLKDRQGWDRRGRSKRYKILEEADALLLEMGEELLRTEEGRIDLLNKIGEMRGLLLNVYF